MQTFPNAFPLLIELRDFYALRQQDECDSFLEYVAYMGKTDQWFLDDHAVHDYLISPTAPSLVMFDGLDEIFDAGDRERVMSEIAGFAQRYPLTRIIVTSRPVGYKEQVLREAGFRHFGLQDLSQTLIEQFILGWFRLTFSQNPQNADQRIARVLRSVKQSPSIRQLAGNPMLLTIMALLAREDELPRERAKFYEKAVEVLCHHWDVNRNLELHDGYLNADDKKDMLRRVAIRMQTGEGGLSGNFIVEDDLEQTILTYLLELDWHSNRAEAKKAARQIIHQLRVRNYILCLRGPRLYGFVHRTFLEYLTAAEYVRRFDRQPQQMTFDELLTLFDQHCQDDDWREVLRLICGQIDPQYVGQIVIHLAQRIDEISDNIDKSKIILPELTLAIYLMGEVRNLRGLEEAGSQLMDRVVRVFQENWGARGDRQNPFQSALVDASKVLRTRWPGVSEKHLASLIPPSLQQSNGIYWPYLIAYIFRRHRFPNLRELLTKIALRAKAGSALQTLAKEWPDDKTHQLLVRQAVSDNNGLTRGQALQALALQWPNEHRRQLLLEISISDNSDSARRAALQALGQHWPDNLSCQHLSLRAVQDEHRWVRIQALRTLVEQWPSEQTRQLLLQRVLEDTHRWVRYEALQLLVGSLFDDQTRQFLIEQTVHNKDYITRGRILQSLAQYWPSNQVRECLSLQAVQDESYWARSQALDAVAQHWTDNQTRQLLIQRAKEDENGFARNKALDMLDQYWPDEETNVLLYNRARVDGFATSYMGQKHSKFGGIVFTKYLYTDSSCLNPTNPIPREHIERAAEKSDIPPNQIDEMVRSLSEYLGWDITRGSAAGLFREGQG